MSDSAFFRPELFQFLRQLKKHNNREWFARNKHRFEAEIREPALLFIGSFAAPLSRITQFLVADTRTSGGSLFRIYRDIRFSHDKRPFKTHVGIQFCHADAKDAHAPCFYLHLEPENCFAAAGVWHPETRDVTKIRTAIVSRPKEWEKVRRKVELEGESLMRPPRGYDPEHPFIEDIKHKDFVASLAFTEKQVCKSSFMRDFTDACRSMSPLVEFTTRALGFKY